MKPVRRLESRGNCGFPSSIYTAVNISQDRVGVVVRLLFIYSFFFCVWQLTLDVNSSYQKSLMYCMLLACCEDGFMIVCGLKSFYQQSSGFTIAYRLCKFTHQLIPYTKKNHTYIYQRRLCVSHPIFDHCVG